MKSGRTSSPANLPDWLAIATRDLVPSAQARVRAEIEAHYAEAVQHYQQGGKAESEAQATALAELGDAAAVGSRFRREHPTKLDAIIFFHLTWLQIFGGMLLAARLILFPFLPEAAAEPSWQGWLVIFLGVQVAIPASAGAMYVLLRWARPALTPRIISLLLLMVWLNFCAYLTYRLTDPFVNDRGFDFWLEVILFFQCTGSSSFLLLNLRKKLTAAPAPGVPPPAATLKEAT